MLDIRGVQAITGATPSKGPRGTVITITGSNLQGVTAVFIGGTAATSINPDPSGTFVTATVGQNTPLGSGTITVTNNGVTETGPTFTVTTPSIVVAPTSLTNFNTIQGTPSNSQSYTVRGDGLGNNALTVAAPANYEVSLVQAGPYSTTGLSLTPNSAGDVPTTTVYVRLTGATTGPYTATVDNASIGAIAQSVSVSGTVFASSFLDASPTQLSGFVAVVGQNSASQSFTITGNGLGARVIVTAPAGYELSTSNAGVYTTSLTLPLTNTAINQVVYVRLQNTNGAGSYGGGVTVASGTNTRNVVLQGTVNNPALAAEPTNQGTLTFGVTTTSTINLTISPGNGTSRILLVRQGSAVDAAPQDAFSYIANPAYGSGSQVGTLNYVVLSGNAADVTVTNLTANTQYFFALYEYNGSGSASNYLTGNPFVANATTLSSAPTLAGELLFEEGFDYPLNTVLTTGTSGVWTELTSGNPTVQTGASSLTFTQYGTPASVGTAARLRGSNGQSVQRRILSGPLAPGDLYMSAEIRVTSPASGNNEDYFMALIPQNTLGSATARVYVRNGSQGNFNIGLSFNGSTVSYARSTSGITDFSTANTYVIVIRYRRIAGANNDQMRMYVLSSNSVPENEPTNPAVADITVPTGAEVDFTHVALRQYNGSQDITVDGIRAGNGWGATVGRPRFIDSQYSLRTGNYYDVSLGGATSTVSVVNGPVLITNALILGQGRLLTTAANLVTLDAGATASAGTNNSFVDGPLAWNSNNNFTYRYPIGKNGIFRPFTFSIIQSGSGTYQIEMMNIAAPSRPLPSNIDRTSAVRYYTIDRIAGTGTATFGQVTLTYGADDGVNDEANLRVVKSSNAGAYEDLGPQTGGTASPSGAITPDPFNESFTAQTVYALANNIPGTNPLGTNPLPVELTSLTVRLQGEQALVNWTTASEKNSSHFEVLRSLDGLEFKQIGSVEAAGNSSSKHRYTFTDVSAPAGLVYYRLRQVDFDGKATLSHIVTLKKTGSFALSLFPNPATEQLTLQAGAEPVQWKVVNGLGQVLLHGDAEGQSILNVGALPAGVYYLEAATGTQRQTQKFVKR